MNYKSLRTKIILILFTGSLVMTLFAASYNYSMRRDVLFQVSIEKLLVLVKTMRSFEKVRLGLVKAQIKMLKSNEQFVDALEISNIKEINDEINKIVPHFKKVSKTLSDIHLYDKNGNFVYNSNILDKKHTHNGKNAVLLQAMKTLTFTKGYALSEDNGFYKSFISPLKKDEKIIGYIEFGMKADYLFKIASKVGRYKYALYLQKERTDTKRELGKLIFSNSKIFTALHITQDFINKNANQNNVVSYHNKYYLLQQYDIETSFQKDFAEVVMATDVTKYVKSNQSDTLFLVGFSFVILFFLLLGVYFFFTKLMNKITQEESKLKASHMQMRTIMDNSENLIALIENEKLIFVNKPFFIFFNFSDMSIFLKKHNNLSELFEVSKNTLSNTAWIQEIQGLEESSKIVRFKSQYVNYFNVKIAETSDAKSTKIITFSNITALYEKSKKDEYMTSHDKLTGLLNRVELESSIEKEMQYHEKNRTDYAVLMLDIDWFKKVNDTYGHQIGDNVLVEISAILKSSVRARDKVFRAGGEEFVIVFSRIEYEDAKVIAQKIRAFVKKHIFRVDEIAFSKTISSGLFHSSILKSKSVTEVLESIDIALYESKENGRDRVTVVHKIEDK